MKKKSIRISAIVIATLFLISATEAFGANAITQSDTATAGILELGKKSL